MSKRRTLAERRVELRRVYDLAAGAFNRAEAKAVALSDEATAAKASGAPTRKVERLFSQFDDACRDAVRLAQISRDRVAACVEISLPIVGRKRRALRAAREWQAKIARIEGLHSFHRDIR